MAAIFTEAIPLKYPYSPSNPYVSYWIGKSVYDDQGRLIRKDANADALPGRKTNPDGSIVIEDGKLREGTMTRIATLRDICEYEVGLDPTRKKHRDGCMHTYVAEYTWVKEEIMKRGIRSGGVIEVDIDIKNTPEVPYADIIYNGFKKLSKVLRNLVAMNFSASHKVHAFMITTPCSPSEYVYRSAAAYLSFVNAVKSELNIDLYWLEKQMKEKIIDNSLIKITQKMFLHASPYQWNDEAIPLVYSVEEMEQLANSEPEPPGKPLRSEKLMETAKKRSDEYLGLNPVKISGLTVSTGKKIDMKDIKCIDGEYLGHEYRWAVAGVLKELGYTDQERFDIMKANISPGDYKDGEWDKCIRAAINSKYDTLPDTFKAKAVEVLRNWGMKIDTVFRIDPSKFPDLDPKYDIRYTKEIQLEDGQYVSDVLKDIRGMIYICADCGIGKTEFAKLLAKEKKVDIVEPMYSILDGKFDDCDWISVIKNPQDAKKDRSQAMIWDTYVRIPYDQRKKIVIFDETHLIVSHTEFRAVAPKLIEQIQQLKNSGVTVVCLDGTPLGEQNVLGSFDAKLHITRKPDANDNFIRRVTFHVVGKNSSCAAVAERWIGKTVSEGRLAVIHTDQYSRDYRDYCNGMGWDVVEYRRDKRESNDMHFINKMKDLPLDTNVVVCTKYMEAGIEFKRGMYAKENDLIIPSWNKDKPSAQQIVQVANRFRGESHNIDIFIKENESLLNIDKYMDVSIDLVVTMGSNSGLIDRDVTKKKVRYLDDLEHKDIYDECGEANSYFRSFPVMWRVFESMGYVVQIVYEEEKKSHRVDLSGVIEKRMYVADMLREKLKDVIVWWPEAMKKECDDVNDIVMSEGLMQMPEVEKVGKVMEVVYKILKKQILVGIDEEYRYEVLSDVLKLCYSERGGISVNKLKHWYRFNKWNSGDDMYEEIKEELIDGDCTVKQCERWWKAHIIDRLLQDNMKVSKADIDTFYNVTIKGFIDTIEIMKEQVNRVPDYKIGIHEDYALEFMMASAMAMNRGGEERRLEGNRKGGSKKGKNVRPIIADGIPYPSITIAAEELGVSEFAIRKKLKDEKYATWCYQDLELLNS